MRRIPFPCKTCLKKLEIPWDLTKDEYNQPRYSQNKSCDFWDVFQGVNDWNVVQILQTNDDEEEEQEIQSCILRKYAQDFSDQILPGDFALFQCDDEDNEDGYYLVQWTSEPYTTGGHRGTCV